MALIEALVASAILGIGLAGATRLTLHALQTANDTRQHTVAQTLGAHQMECLLSGRAACDLNHVTTVQGTTYTLQSQLHPRPDLSLVDIEVQVQWPAAGVRPDTASPGSGQADALKTGQLVWHSSRDLVPSWLGVSLP